MQYLQARIIWKVGAGNDVLVGGDINNGEAVKLKLQQRHFEACMGSTDWRPCKNTFRYEPFP